MNYLNLVRGAVDLCEFEGKTDKLTELHKNADQFLMTFHNNNESQSQSEMGTSFAKERDVLVTLLEGYGIEDAATKLDLAANYQGLNDQNYAISTLTTVGGKTVETTSIPMIGLDTTSTSEQRNLFENLDNKKWFQALSKTEQELCKKYAPKIREGHMIPTQLVRIPGIRNSYETITRLHETGKEPQILDRNFHSGTVANLGKNEAEAIRLTKEAIEQAADKMIAASGLSREDKGVIIHVNTLNASFGPNGDDTKIVKRVGKAVAGLGGSYAHTNTCFNAMRIVGASKYDGAHNMLDKLRAEIVAHTNDMAEGKGFKGAAAATAIEEHLRPKGLMERAAMAVGIKKRPMALNAALDSLNIQGAKREVIESAAALTDKLGKTSTRGLDKENLDLQINQNIQELSQATLKPGGFETKILNISMCKSGKDRRGLSGHNITAEAVAQVTGVSIQEVDASLLRGGHTAHMAGAISAGGGGIGAMGTKSENRAGIPASRRESLEPIIEKTASYNKVKKIKVKITKKIQKAISQVFSSPQKIKASAAAPTASNTMEAHSQTATSKPQISDQTRRNVNQMRNANFGKSAGFTGQRVVSKGKSKGSLSV